MVTLWLVFFCNNKLWEVCNTDWKQNFHKIITFPLKHCTYSHPELNVLTYENGFTATVLFKSKVDFSQTSTEDVWQLNRHPTVNNPSPHTTCICYIFEFKESTVGSRLLMTGLGIFNCYQASQSCVKGRIKKTM